MEHNDQDPIEEVGMKYAYLAIPIAGAILSFMLIFIAINMA